MRLIEPLLQELDRAAVVTRKLLSRVPEASLGWTPHPGAMTLGQLALHVATLPGDMARAAQLDMFEPDALGAKRQAAARTELLAALATSVADARHLLLGMSDRFTRERWSCARGGQLVETMPRDIMLREVLLNHWYHHRGQLTVYLRLLGVPLPAFYEAGSEDQGHTGEEPRGPFDVSVPAAEGA